MKKRYRFKTEKEFIEQYGNTWHTSVQYGWSESMNDLFGQEYTGDLPFGKAHVEYDGWYISPDMLIEIEEVNHDLLEEAARRFPSGCSYITPDDVKCDNVIGTPYWYTEENYKKGEAIALADGCLLRLLKEVVNVSYHHIHSS